MTAPASPALEALPCDACGAPGAAPYSHASGAHTDLCPACAAREALRDGAAAALPAMLAPVVGRWAAHWQAAGLDVGELLALLEYAALEAARPVHTDRRALARLQALARQHGTA